MVDRLGPICLCGRRGCLAAVASEPAILSNARQLLMPGSGSSGFALELPDHKALTLAEIAEIAQESNRTAHSLIRNAVNNVLYTVSTTATVLNIELIVLGDESVQELGELLFEDAQDCLGKYRQCIQALRVLRASLEMNAFPLGIILLKSREILR